MKSYNNMLLSRKHVRRDSNIELFRIVIMLLIIAHHYVVNSKVGLLDGPIYVSGIHWRSIFTLVLGMWGKTGINCFVLITGYYMCKSKITLLKFTKLLGEVMFYKIVITIIFWVTGYEAFSIQSFVRTIVPFTTIAHNFTGCFLLFYLAIPFLNILLNNIERKTHRYLIALSCFIYVLFGSVPLLDVTMNYVSWFIVIYFISSYIRLYWDVNSSAHNRWKNRLFVMLTIDIASVVVLYWGIFKISMLHGISAMVLMSDSNKLLCLLTGISAFMYFKTLQIGYHKLINTIASTTFGVFIIHTCGDSMREWLWHDLIKPDNIFYIPFMPLYAMLIVLLIFIVCSLIDELRQHLIEKPFLSYISRHIPLDIN